MKTVPIQKLMEVFDFRNSYVNGNELWASCPCPENHKHGDRKPSWSINLETMKHHCFSCGFSGDVVTLCMKEKNCTRSQAVHLLYGDISKVELLELLSGSEYQSQSVDPIERDISSWARNKHEYWHTRGFSDETIKKWQLGYDPQMNRVTVPIYFDKKLVGWTARATNNSTIPKWLHSKDLPREHILFGLDNKKTDSCILVEAPLSVIMLDQYGIGDVIASFGCQLSDGQARLIRANFDNVLIFYDPDPAGRYGTQRVISMLEPHCKVYVVRPTRDDPAAITKEECWQAIYKTPVTPSWAFRP